MTTQPPTRVSPDRVVEAFAERFKTLRAEQQVRAWAALREESDRGGRFSDLASVRADLHTDEGQRERSAAGHKAARACAEELQCLHRHPDMHDGLAGTAPQTPAPNTARLQPAHEVPARSDHAARTRELNERKLAAVKTALRQLPATRQHELYHALADLAAGPPRPVADRIRTDPLLARKRQHCERWQAELDFARERLTKYRKAQPLAARFSKEGAERERQVITIARRLGEVSTELAQSYRLREVRHREALRREQSACALAQGMLSHQAARCEVPTRRLALERFAREHNALRDPNASLAGQQFLLVQIAEQKEGTFLRFTNGRRHFVLDRDALDASAPTRLGSKFQVQHDLRVSALPARDRTRSTGIDR